MADAVIHFYPGDTVLLLYSWPDDGTGPLRESRILDIVFGVFDAFWPAVLEPLAATLNLVCVDAWGFRVGTEPEKSSWLLRTPEPAEWESSIQFSGEVEREVPALTRQALVDWIQEALRQPPLGEADHVAWSELSFPATRVRVFEPERFAGRDSILLDTEVGVVQVPLERDERGVWLSGPLQQLFDQPPVTLSLHRPSGALHLKVHAHWSLWTQEGSPGKAAIDAALAFLLTRGWVQGPEEV